MTALHKSVSRRTTILLDNRLHSRSRDQVTVTLHPNNTIGFKPLRRRHEFVLDLAVAYKLAITNEAREKLIQKQKEAKALGKRFRKPKRSLLF